MGALHLCEASRTGSPLGGQSRGGRLVLRGRLFGWQRAPQNGGQESVRRVSEWACTKEALPQRLANAEVMCIRAGAMVRERRREVCLEDLPRRIE